MAKHNEVKNMGKITTEKKQKKGVKPLHLPRCLNCTTFYSTTGYSNKKVEIRNIRAHERGKGRIMEKKMTDRKE